MQCSIHSGAVIYSRPLIAANNGDIPGRFVVYLKNGEWQAGSRVTLIVSMGQSKGTVESIFGVFSRGDLGRAAVGQVVMQTGGRTVPLFSQPCPWGERLVGKFRASHEETVAFDIPSDIQDASKATLVIQYFLARVAVSGFYNDSGNISIPLAGTTSVQEK